MPNNNIDNSHVHCDSNDEEINEELALVGLFCKKIAMFLCIHRVESETVEMPTSSVIKMMQTGIVQLH
jgi:hypothetical protein